MRKQRLISILIVLMLSFILVFASCGPTKDPTGDGGSGDGGNNDGGDGGNNDGGDGGNNDGGDGGAGDGGGGNNDGGDGGNNDGGDGGAGDGGSTTTTYTLDVTVNDENMGSVTIDPATGPYEEDSTVTIEATPKTKAYKFTTWTGDVTSDEAAENPLELTMDENKTIEAVFATKTIYTLSVKGGDNPENGTVTVGPEPIEDPTVSEDGTTTSYKYYEGETVVVTADPTLKKYLAEWTGAPEDDKTSNPLKFYNFSENITLTATWGDLPDAEELTVGTWKEDTLTKNYPIKLFYFNATVDKNYAFYTVDKGIGHPDNPNNGVTPALDNMVGLYKEDGSPYTYDYPLDDDNNPITGWVDLFLSYNRIVFAAEEDKVYVKVKSYYDGGIGNYWVCCKELNKLTVKPLEKGTGMDDVDPNSVSFISPEPGEYLYAKGDKAEITVTVQGGYYLSEWTDDASTQTDYSISITMDGDKTVGAKISKLNNQFRLTREIVGKGDVNITNPTPVPMGEVFDENTDVTLNAVPGGPKWVLEKWMIYDGGSQEIEKPGTENPLTVKMDSSKTVTAHFKPMDQKLEPNTWTEGDLFGLEEQLFWFAAEAGKTYHVYTHDKYFYHPENPGDSTFDNNVGVYKDNSGEPGDSYTYPNLGNASGQVDIYVWGGTDNPYIEIEAEGDKVWVKVTAYNPGAEGPYWVKVMEKPTTTQTLSITLEGYDKDEDWSGVLLDWKNINPADPDASPLVYTIPTGEAVVVGIEPGTDRKVVISGANAADVIPYEDPNESHVGMIMDGDKVLTLTFSPKE